MQTQAERRPPFGTLALNSCPFAGAFFSFVGRYFLLAIFVGDDSISNSILRGFLTATLIHITLEFHSQLIRTIRHFTFVRRL
jgi:hypothetical protein